jgi:hypothetical protein
MLDWQYLSIFFLTTLKEKMNIYGTKSSETIIFSRKVGSTLQKRSLLYKTQKTKCKRTKKYILLTIHTSLLNNCKKDFQFHTESKFFYTKHKIFFT